MSRDALLIFCTEHRLAVKPVAVLVVLLTFAVGFSFGVAIHLEAADYQTPNFTIQNAPDYGLARQFGETAERLRKEMAVCWLGIELPRWSAPCPIFVIMGDFSAGGETSMDFHHGEVYGWNMKVQGSVESILTAVLPHEITHTILASHFRQPAPRWFDEGAATYVENEKERQNYRRLLYHYLRTGRGIPFNRMFRMGEYPDDQMPLYAQGFSLAEFLIMQQGHRHYVDFASAGMKTDNWPQAMRDYYGYENLGELQVKWNRWVNAGCPDLDQISHDQPIRVSDTTQYIAFRDFLPMRQPVILASVLPVPRDVIPASWESPQATQNILSGRQSEREPIRVSMPQGQQNHQLVTNDGQMNDTRLPSYSTDHQTVSGQQNRHLTLEQMDFNQQQPYQSSRSFQPPLPRDNDSHVNFEWRIR